MYFGIVETESLENPSLLEKYVPAKVIPQKVDDAETKLWHLNVLRVDAADGRQVAEEFAEIMMHGWYGVLWDEKEFYVILPKRAFKLRRGESESKEYNEMKEHAVLHGVQEEYLDFNKNFIDYIKLTEDL